MLRRSSGRCVDGRTGRLPGRVVLLNVAMASPVADDSPSVWTPADFPDESPWSADLTERRRRSLTDYGRGGPVVELRDRLGIEASRWAQLLNGGPGFVRLRGFPIEEPTEEQTARAHLGRGALRGRPVGTLSPTAHSRSRGY